MSKPFLYVNSKGFPVTRHSYSGSESFGFCPRKYYLERVQGWQQREQRSSTAFGKTLENAITFWHQRGQNTDAAVAEFARQWAEYKDKDLTYTKSDLDWDRLNLTGQELVRLYAIRYPDFPYTVDNPDFAFQVERNVEVFPGSKLEGLTFIAYLDMVATLKATGEPFVGDMKTSGKEVPEFTELDPQLRSYAWVTGYPNVGFIWFRKMGRTISKGDMVTLLEPTSPDVAAGTEGWVVGKDILGGYWITISSHVRDHIEQIDGKSKAAEAARQQYAEEHGILVPERSLTKQRLYFKHVVMYPTSIKDIGRAIKRDIVNITKSTEMDFFPMQSGVRYPNEKCPNCAMRGICSNRPELRDALLERKQVDELEFVKIEGVE